MHRRKSCSAIDGHGRCDSLSSPWVPGSDLSRFRVLSACRDHGSCDGRSFLDPESDPLGKGYQLIQSKIALGSGGFSGKGFLQGTQSYLEFLPEKQTDFIFTLIGEEFGFLGTISILFLFSLLILICFYVSFRSFHIFGRIISLGVASNLFLYVLLNLSMVTGLMPVVGIPLPLLSYGGTAMLSIMISFGLLLNVDIQYSVKKFND